MLFRQTLFAKTLKFFISVMAFKEIRQTLLIQIYISANLPNFHHLRYFIFCCCCTLLLTASTPAVPILTELYQIIPSGQVQFKSLQNSQKS